MRDIFRLFDTIQAFRSYFQYFCHFNALKYKDKSEAEFIVLAFREYYESSSHDKDPDVWSDNITASDSLELEFKLFEWFLIEQNRQNEAIENETDLQFISRNLKIYSKISYIVKNASLSIIDRYQNNPGRLPKDNNYRFPLIKVHANAANESTKELIKELTHPFLFDFSTDKIDTYEDCFACDTLFYSNRPFFLTPEIKYVSCSLRLKAQNLRIEYIKSVYQKGYKPLWKYEFEPNW